MTERQPPEAARSAAQQPPGAARSNEQQPSEAARSAEQSVSARGRVADALTGFAAEPWQRPTVRPLGRRLDMDRDSVERGLSSLVLTVVELLRQLMERQALRRVDEGDLTDEQVERVGATLMALDEQMAQLREYFGLAPEDLNLDLGPLGPLLPTD